MNYIATKNFMKLNEIEKPFYEIISKVIRKENIFRIYEKLKDHPLVRWKDSIKKILIKNNINEF